MRLQRLFATHHQCVQARQRHGAGMVGAHPLDGAKRHEQLRPGRLMLVENQPRRVKPPHRKLAHESHLPYDPYPQSGRRKRLTLFLTRE
ncbi:unnamed protein product [Rangifer tarandus platyrhynchus]|uniref:Uncharacterized protein n=1 Tax=Rangifer tarandus platyrhynchus TaxID=3082113 RepID=A0ABN8XM61_RANTA|nr:unnamed protein product [Rangifer tarandus platyrhynchus]